MTDDMHLTADNSNAPLWKQAALRVALEEGQLDILGPDELAALFEKARQVMKPSAEELAALRTDKKRQMAYVLTFVRAYKAGLPPLSSLGEAARNARN